MGKAQNLKWLLIFLIYPFLLLSCATAKVASDFGTLRNEIRNITIVEPYVHLEKFEANDRIVDTEGNLVAKENLYTGIENTLKPKCMCRRMELQEEKVQMVEKELLMLFHELDRSKDVSSVEIPNELKNIMLLGEDRYFVVCHHKGFTRTSGNYGKEIGQSCMIGILTLGMFTVVPIGSGSCLYVAILDKENTRVIYFNTNCTENNPTKRKITDGQLSSLFNKILDENRK